MKERNGHQNASRLFTDEQLTHGSFKVLLEAIRPSYSLSVTMYIDKNLFNDPSTLLTRFRMKRNKRNHKYN